ncbi:hypothetical protein PHLGIDRAFT_19535 [Phlebiopsis gigantea 11061_1 CR5-6]|uniref:Uncharacterized protein n=1 Tax=Phlebiopsis gigantea (strain 11061_1 CR5-6) TaxID=745531 RepID=A0A0C3NLY9_PHLG1|nr:hypothetical protein PHLGIDRAFT_19535 [Phlebiopsis gigantea 11061_1 CR5-6]
MHKLRDQMPIMARRHRLVFRMSRKYAYDSHKEDIKYETVLGHVFEHDSPYWKNIDIDLQPSPEPQSPELNSQSESDSSSYSESEDDP